MRYIVLVLYYQPTVDSYCTAVNMSTNKMYFSLSKLGPCQAPSTVGNSLTMDKLLFEPHCNKSKFTF